jgi:phage terminase small subunit
MTLVDAFREVYPNSRKWKPQSAHANASALAAEPRVAELIRLLQDAAADMAGLEAAQVLREVGRIAFSDIAKVMNPDGTVKLPHELDADTRAAVKKFEIDELGRIKYEFYDKGQALDKAMRHLGLYEKDNSQQQIGLQALLALLTGAVVRPDPRAAQPDHDEGHHQPRSDLGARQPCGAGRAVRLRMPIGSLHPGD